MISCTDFLAWLEKVENACFASLPDSLLKNVCAFLTALPGSYVSAANGGGSVVLYRLSIEAFCRKIRATA